MSLPLSRYLLLSVSLSFSFLTMGYCCQATVQACWSVSAALKDKLFGSVPPHPLSPPPTLLYKGVQTALALLFVPTKTLPNPQCGCLLGMELVGEEEDEVEQQ